MPKEHLACRGKALLLFLSMSVEITPLWSICRWRLSIGSMLVYKKKIRREDCLQWIWVATDQDKLRETNQWIKETFSNALCCYIRGNRLTFNAVNQYINSTDHALLAIQNLEEFVWSILLYLMFSFFYAHPSLLL